jgi:DNA (cytosine-5)-methyltransferase 1
MSPEIDFLDLFSGIGGFSVGLQSAGFKIRNHYYSEIDRHAIAVYKYQFNNAIYAGSVTTMERGTMPPPNIITFGSPCQDFSLAGERKGLTGSKSSLIGEAIRLIALFRPDIFIWENVKGVFSANDGRDFWAVIKAFTNIGGYRLEWQLLNTSWFLPQNRERIYLIGYLAENGRSFKGVFPFREDDRLFKKEHPGENHEPLSSITATEHKGPSKQRPQNLIIQKTSGKTITIKNDECGTLQSGGANVRDKTPNILTHYGHKNKDAQEHEIVPTLKAESHGHEPMVGTLRTHKDGLGFREIKSNDCPTIPARARTDGSGQPVIKVAKPSRTEEAKKIRSEIRKEGRDHTPFSGKNFEFVDTDLMNTISTSLAPDNLLELEVANCVTPDAYLARGERKRDSDGKAVLTSMHERRIRRLTEIECERLQGFPDDWTKYGNYDGEIKEVSKTQRYKMCGNAVTVNVVTEIGKRLIKNL